MTQFDLDDMHCTESALGKVSFATQGMLCSWQGGVCAI